MSADRERGALAIVLHTHMPYVEGFGTWPFGEEWLWEAIVGSYVPLLGLLDCAYAAWLEPILREAGTRAVCVEMTARLGLGAREHLRAYVGDSGVVLVPIDRATMSPVWSERGYPASGHYRDYHHHTVHH